MMRSVKVVLLMAGILVVVLASILDDINERNDWLAGGLLLFSLTAASYFIAWPVSRDEGKWHFNSKFVWLSIYLTVAVTCTVWLWLLKMA